MSGSGSPTYYGPVGETSSDILLEKTFLASGYLTGVGFGIQFVLYLQCLGVLWQRKPQSCNLTLSSRVLIPYLTILCAMNLIWTATSAYGLQLTFIDNRNYPGGPVAFLGVEFALPDNVVSLASYIAANIMADALMIWRCYVVWDASQGSKAKYVVLIIPCMMLLTNLALAVLFALETTGPPGLFASITASFAVPYFALSMSMNVILTFLIVGRIWFCETRRRGSMGWYTFTKAIFVESAAMYSIIGFLLMVTFAIGHPINQIWLGIAPSVQLIANYLIVYRVENGGAWNDRQSAPGHTTHGYPGDLEKTDDDLSLGSDAKGERN
ncbi:hypothetical protein SISSUDRAFT_1057041 [Sistotremastrum suecicum HHB10207 ss-3]|uniref:Uncharacterized protein n=1 Tax=Sistotremastrum suecicum HHB10207 ss-3 TaxID=1314776 RepID=A0A166ISS6_9AGAM|nr:hypothetical protein SISSUDRAFT_1057041 [Sistotremastrum suecicum HHB10207 ss-3]